MARCSRLLGLLLLPVCAAAQQGHAHNDYEHERPLFDALERGFTSIEADVYLVNGALLVAHHKDSVRASRTLEGMYLAPLRAYVRTRGGGPQIQLLIDVKSDAQSTYAALDSVLRRYADVLASPGETNKPLTAVISGERDISAMRGATRRHASVDGRPADVEAPSALVPLISEDWGKFTKGLSPDSARARLVSFVALAHRNGKKVRFWATPDNAAMWTLLADAGVDYIGADDLDGLRDFLARRKATSTRVLLWNVSDTAWTRNPSLTKALFRHADPDVFVLVQVGTTLDSAAIRGMLTGLRGASDTTWHLSIRGRGDVEQSVIASRDSVRPLREFETLTYPDTGALSLRATPDTTAATPVRDRVNRVHANAAMVRSHGRWLMVVGAHLTCCGAPATWREPRRQLGAIVIRDRMRDVLRRERPAGVVLAGDLNLVEGAAPLDTLLGTIPGMHRAEALHPDGWSDWTWDGRGSAFNGGRLDNVLYSSRTLRVTFARVWDTESMPASTLRANGLTAESSRSINRHRPVVVDLR